MILTSLTPDELERLAYIEPARPDVVRAHAAVIQREIGRKDYEIDRLEKQVTELEDWNGDE